MLTRLKKKRGFLSITHHHKGQNLYNDTYYQNFIDQKNFKATSGKTTRDTKFRFFPNRSVDQQKILKTGWEGLVKFIGTHKTENDVIKMMRKNIENLTKKQIAYM